MTRPSGSKRQSLAAALLCGSLASASVGCTNPSPKVPPPPKPQPTMAPLAVGDADFAKAVHRLLRERARTPQRSALLVGAVRRQLVHAGSRFDAGDETGGTSAVMGALYLLRVGDARKDLFDPSSRGALAGAMRKFSARGDVGRARALMVMQATLFRDGSTERKELDSHIKALEQWMADTRTGGTIVSLADEERAAVGRALVDPSEGPIDEAAKAIDKWIDRAIEYNIAYQQTHQLPARDEAQEAFRALRTGGASMAALYLRHGDARGAIARIERSSAERVIPMQLFAMVRAAAVDDTAADWRLLARHLDRGTYDAELDELALEPYLLDAAVWGAAIEAYRRDPTSLAIAHILSKRLIDLRMPEAVPLVLADAIGSTPNPLALGSAMDAIGTALAAETNTATARRVYGASKPLLALADASAMRKQVNPSSASVRITMAEIELLAGQVDAARPLLLRALQAEPSVHGYTLLAKMARQGGQSDKALLHAVQASELPGAAVLPLDATEAWLLRYELQRDKGAVDKAQTSLEKALKIALSGRARRAPTGTRVRAERLLARVLDGFGDADAGDRAFSRALEMAEADRRHLGPTVRFAVGRALVNKNLRAARSALHRGLGAGLDADELAVSALWLSLLERRMGEKSDGKVDRVLLELVNRRGWAAKLARWGRGTLSDEKLLAGASGLGERTQADFCIALRKMLAGGEAARASLGKVANSPLVHRMEVRLARDLLAPQLKLKLPATARVP